MNIWERWKKTSLSNKLLVVLTALLAGFGYWQISITRESSHKELRAYLAIVDLEDSLDIWVHAETVRHLHLERLNSVRWHLKNLGKTPAYDVRDTVYLVVRDSIDEDPRFLHVQKQPSFTVGPELFINCSRPKIAVDKGNRLRIFLVGKITYRDVFEESHVITFLFEYIYGSDNWSANHPFNREYDE